MPTANTMRTITIQPGVANSLQLEEFKAPPPERGSVLLHAAALGVCGTDHDIIQGKYGEAPAGHKRLILGHESLGRVVEASSDSGLAAGDLAVGIVRHPDPVPCPNCAVGQWDMCRNEQFTERGIKQLDGFGSELYRLEPQFVVPIDASLGLTGVLVEPTSVVAKAWEHIERIGQRSRWEPRKVLITGAGPVGLLAALLGRQRNFEVHLLDRATDGPKPALARDLGAKYHVGKLADLDRDFDIVLECAGVPALGFESVRHTAPDGIVCLLGVSAPGDTESIDIGALNMDVVIGNRVIFGSVNANRGHYDAAAKALSSADREWLHRIISRRVPLREWATAFERRPNDVKVVIDFGILN